eukprot:1281813-Rhodomonas_salina.1
MRHYLHALPSYRELAWPHNVFEYFHTVPSYRVTIRSYPALVLSELQDTSSIIPSCLLSDTHSTILHATA